MFLTILVPVALLDMASYAPPQIASAIFCWLAPLGFLASFWWGRRAMFREVPELEPLRLELEGAVPMTWAQRVVLVWLVAGALLLFIWLSLGLAFGQVTGRAAWILALWVGCAAFLSAVTGYVLGYIPLSDRRKFGVYAGAFFSLCFGAGLLYEFATKWQEDPQVLWGTAAGAIVSLLTLYYLHSRWDPADLETVNQTRAESYLDILFLTNGCFRALFMVALGIGFTIMINISEQFTLMVISAWLSTLSGYMSVQAWRHRPSPRSGLP